VAEIFLDHLGDYSGIEKLRRLLFLRLCYAFLSRFFVSCLSCSHFFPPVFLPLVSDPIVTERHTVHTIPDIQVQILTRTLGVLCEDICTLRYVTDFTNVGIKTRNGAAVVTNMSIRDIC